jgi:hypothetical protein
VSTDRQRGEDRFRGLRSGPGSRWVSATIVCFLAGVGGLVKGVWWAALFIPLALVLAYGARKFVRRGDF